MQIIKSRATPSISQRILLMAGIMLAPMLGCGPQHAPSAATHAQDTMPNDGSQVRLPEDEIIYFLLPDRFANGDTRNDTGGINGERLQHGFDPTHKGFYHGGDIKGVIEKLDYIQNLGATAIWLGPIYKNKPVQGKGDEVSAGYHGYWIIDFTSVDPHFGTQDDLKTLVRAIHARGMKIYLDIITNHTADVIALRECHDTDGTSIKDNVPSCPYRSRADYPFSTRGGVTGEKINHGFLGIEDHLQTPENFVKLRSPDYAYTPYITKEEENSKSPAWLNDPIYYHNRGESHWSGQSAIQGDFAGLDDLMTEHPVVVEGMIDIFRDWISTYHIDGFRIDTAKHVNPHFWRQFIPAIKAHAASEGIVPFYIFGEAYYDQEPEMLAWHTRGNGFENVLDFAVAQSIQDYVASPAPAILFEKLFFADALYENGQKTAMRNPTFIGNHDMGRISGKIKAYTPDITQEELLQRVTLAHSLMIFLRGVPVIYSGDEQGFVSDGGDQLAREDMFPSQVRVYNDNDLLGTDATTAAANFDMQHPLYLKLQQSIAIRKEHTAFRRGILIPRLLSETDKALAFSRIDPETGQEYVVIVNGDTQEKTFNVPVDALSARFTSLAGSCPLTPSTRGILRPTLKPLTLIICKANTPSSRTWKEN